MATKKKNNSLNWLEDLTRTFRSGIRIRHKVPTAIAGKTASDVVGHLSSKNYFYMHPNQIYGTYDRMIRYADFAEMEFTPECASALDIYAEECTSRDENGHVLKVISNNSRIKQILESFYSDVISIDHNIFAWVRNLCKYGDFFLFVDIHPSYGVTNVFPIPVDQIEREEGYDNEDPFAVRFNWITNGNQHLDNHQVIHFRLLGNDSFLPYGQSLLEPSRRIWRQLTLLEDAVMVYRLVRSPERRVFKIDVGNIPPEHVDAYVEKVKSKMKRQIVTNETTGRVDLRYSAMTVEDDYYIPVRGDRGSEISTLAGGQYTGDIQDIEYMQGKLFAALKIPRSYLGYNEGETASNTLSQIDIRFNKMIQRIQRVIESELKKLAMIHLYAFGFRGEELVDFDLKLAASSMLSVQQNQEIWRSRFELMGNLPDSVSQRWAMKSIMGFDDDELEGIFNDKIREAEEQIIIDEISSSAGGGGGGLGGLGGGGGFGVGDLGGTGGNDVDDIFSDDFSDDDGGGGDADLGGDSSGGSGPAGSEVEDLFAGEADLFSSQLGPFGADGSVLQKDTDKAKQFARRRKQQALKRAITYGNTNRAEDDGEGLDPVQRTGDSGRTNAPGQGRKRDPGSSPDIRGGDGTGKRHISTRTGRNNPTVKRNRDELISDRFKRKLRTNPIKNRELQSLRNSLQAAFKDKIFEDLEVSGAEELIEEALEDVIEDEITEDVLEEVTEEVIEEVVEENVEDTAGREIINDIEEDIDDSSEIGENEDA